MQERFGCFVLFMQDRSCLDKVFLLGAILTFLEPRYAFVYLELFARTPPVFDRSVADSPLYGFLSLNLKLKGISASKIEETILIRLQGS